MKIAIKPILPEPRPSAKSQVDTPAPGVCRSLFPRGNVLKAEIVRLVAGLGVLKHYAVTVIRLAADDSDTVVVPDIQVEIFFIDLCHFFDGHDPFAVDDSYDARNSLYLSGRRAWNDKCSLQRYFPVS